MKEGDRLVSRVCCDHKRKNGFRLSRGEVKLDLSKKFFCAKGSEELHRLPKEVVDASSLWTPKVRLLGL